jgi:predicted transposase/invertase (TIGR01784 family)
MTKSLVSFDWAIQGVLQKKENFCVLEGFLTVLFNDPVQIIEIIDKNTNGSSDDKHCQVDLAVRNNRGRIVIVEIHTGRDKFFMKKIAGGASRLIAERVLNCDRYDNVAKVISVNLLFHRAETTGIDCLYGTTEFKNLRNLEPINLTPVEEKEHNINSLGAVFPEYYLIDVEKFGGNILSNLDEWLYFLRFGKVEDNFTAPGLKACRVILNTKSLSEDEFSDFLDFQQLKQRMVSLEEAAYDHGLERGLQEGLKEGLKEGMVEGRKEGWKEGRTAGWKDGRRNGVEEGSRLKAVKIARNLLLAGVDIQTIAAGTGLTEEEIQACLSL